MKVINKTNAKVLGSIIKMNRIRQNMSQKALAEGICVNSYLSRIENADILPSEDVIRDLFSALAITYKDDDAFVTQAYQDFDAFLDELMFNEFDQSHKRFLSIEENEDQYVHSPVIIDYFIIKLAFYCTQNKTVFNQTRELLHAIKDLMTPDQKFRYYLYCAIDALKADCDHVKAMALFDKALDHGSNGHLYHWRGFAKLVGGQAVAAMDDLRMALEAYVKAGNVTSMIGAYEMIGLIYYYDNDYKEGISSYKTALRYAKTLKHDYCQTNISNQLAWGYLRLGNYQKTQDYLVTDRYNSDTTVNASVTRFVLGVITQDTQGLKDLKSEFNYRNRSLHRMIYSVLCKKPIFDEKGVLNLSDNEVMTLYEFAKYTHVELEKAFRDLAIQYYAGHRKYKEALQISTQSML